MELYGIAEAPGLLAAQHFLGTRSAPPTITSSIVEHIFDRHEALGVTNVLWQLGRSFMAFHTDHPLLTPMGAIPASEGRDAELDENTRRWLAYFRSECPLRRALDTAAERGLPLWGWLCMNRNYGLAGGASHASRFWRDHHEALGEWDKEGGRNFGRMSYFFSEVRAERLAAVLEAAGVSGPRSGKRLDAIVLDFCRQPPMLLYHPAMCAAYQSEFGLEPRSIRAQDGEPFLTWCRWRAGILTQFLREARAALDALGTKLGSRCRIIPRITDLGLTVNLIEGVEIERWCAEGLVDGLITNPLNWIRGVSDHDVRPYTALGRQYGLPVIACVCLNQQTRFHRVPGSVSLARLARRIRDFQLQGAQGIAFYQSECGLEFDGIEDVVPACADPARLDTLLQDDAFLRRWPVTHLNASYGLDCHSWFDDWTMDGQYTAI
jgi:hypothetical protein